MGRLLATKAPAAIWVCLVVGAVFLSDGIQKCPYPRHEGRGDFSRSAPGSAPHGAVRQDTCGGLRHPH
jgi:hypothetical protein